ncbi:MAG TPA: hypothetical protein VFK80_11335, partial [Limnochordia bacterium]|nr:hypothetical protein [Limnochordia bacterium]
MSNSGGPLRGADRRTDGFWRRLAIELVRLYPVAWRKRYADEMYALLESAEGTPGRCWDLLRGALDAQLHPPGFGEGFHMEQLTRSAGWLLFAFAGFIAAGFAYSGMMDDNLRQWAASGSGALLAYHLIQAGAAVFAVAAAAAAWPIVASGVRSGDRAALAWLAVPLALAIAFAAGVAALVWIARTNADAAVAGRGLFVALQLYLLAGTLFSAHAARRFLQRTRPAAGVITK